MSSDYDWWGPGWDSDSDSDSDDDDDAAEVLPAGPPTINLITVPAEQCINDQWLVKRSDGSWTQGKFQSIRFLAKDHRCLTLCFPGSLEKDGALANDIVLMKMTNFVLSKDVMLETESGSHVKRVSVETFAAMCLALEKDNKADVLGIVVPAEA